MTAFSLSARLRLGANSDLALSLPQSRLLFFGRASLAPSPLAARASAVRSRTCGRQRLAASLYPPQAALESQTPQREPRRLPPHAAEFSKVRTAVKPAGAGCPHPSRRGVTPHRATFPKGKAKAVLESQPFGMNQTYTAVHLCTEKPPD